MRRRQEFQSGVCKMPDHIKRSLNMILMLDKKVRDYRAPHCW